MSTLTENVTADGERDNFIEVDFTALTEFF